MNTLSEINSVVENKKHSISIIIPAYNEEDRLPSTLDRLLNWMSQSSAPVEEVIVVDDGSQDRTRAIVQEYAKIDGRIRLVEGSHVGQMNAILTGFKAANSSYLMNLDADCPIDPAEIDRLLPHLHENHMVMGSRMLKGKNGEGSVVGKSLFRSTLSHGYSLFFRLLFSPKIYDPQVGFKIYRSSAIKSIIGDLKLPHDGLKSSEIVLRVYGGGYQIKEIPITYIHDEDSRCVPNKFPIKIISSIIFHLFLMRSILSKDFKNGVLKVKVTRI